MKALKLSVGILLALAGLLAFIGKGKNPDGSAVTVWQQAQDHFGAGLLLLIGAALIISGSRKKDDE